MSRLLRHKSVDLFRSRPSTASSSSSTSTSRPQTSHSTFSTSSTLQKPLLSTPKSDFESTDIPFHEHAVPTYSQLEYAASLPVISQTGESVSFGTLFKDRKTIVCFIRHFLCPLCQDYMFSISRNVSPQVLEEHGVNLVIISNGSYAMIKSYRKIFRTPFAVYTDPTHQVYNVLGMTLQTTKGGPHRPAYVRHNTLSGTCMVVANALKVGMPLWKPGGNISQLGGEFILGPGLQCAFAHRMRYTRSHMPILEIVKVAGVDMYTPLIQITAASTASIAQTEFNGVTGTSGPSFLSAALRMSVDEERKWMQDCRRYLAAMHAKKLARRGGDEWVASLKAASENGHVMNGDESVNQTPMPSPTSYEFTPEARRSSLSSSCNTPTSREFSSTASRSSLTSPSEICTTPTSRDFPPSASCSTPITRDWPTSCSTSCDYSSGDCSTSILDDDSLAEYEDAFEPDPWEQVQIQVDAPSSPVPIDDGLNEKLYPFLLPNIPSLPSLSTDSFETTLTTFISEPLADIPESVSEAESELSENRSDISETSDVPSVSVSEFSETHSLSEFPRPPSLPHLELRIDTEYLSWGDSLKLKELKKLNGSRIIDLPLVFAQTSGSEES